MLVRLVTPYVDTTAAQLSFGWGLPRQPALHVLDVPAGAGQIVQLRLLGASHQVVLGGMSETVACLPGHPPSLPSIVDKRGYRFTAHVHRLTPAELNRWVDAVRAVADRDPCALVGVFPGEGQAVTVLAARARGSRVRWRTWHAYPRCGELVQTDSEVSL